MPNNTKKIKRSKTKSRYGRTRRQRRKPRCMRGGFAFGDLINVFKPKTQEQKCEEAQQEAEKICNKPVPVLEEEPIVEPAPTLEAPVVSDSETPLDQEQSFSPSLDDGQQSPSMNDNMSSPPISPSSSLSPSPSPYPSLSDDIPPSLPLTDEFSSPPLGQQQQQQEQLDQQLPSIATLPPSTHYGGQVVALSGGAKKSKKNKKQNRRKKMKTRRNKK